MEDEDRSVIISIPKPRVCAKESEVSIKKFKRRFKMQCAVSRRRPSEISLKKYSLPGSKPLEVKKLSNELLLLPYRLFSKRQESERRKTKLGITIYEKYKICSTDLRRRLHVEDPPDDIRALTDIDKKYFTCVNGRPICSSIPLFKSLTPLLDKLFRLRHEVSIRNDCILRIETNIRTELQTYENSVQRCKDQASHFDRFILDDYLRSMAFLNKSDEFIIKINSKAMELQHLANDKFAIMSRLIGLDYRYSVQQKYGRFLYYLSPPSWRMQHRDFARSVEIEERGFDLGHSCDEDPFVVIFEKLKKEGSQNSVKPALYFTSPDDLMEVFEGVEYQQLHYLTHVTYSTPYTHTLRKGVITLKNIMHQSSYSVVNSINDFKALLEDCFARCNYLKAKFHKILNGMFYDSVGSLDVLKLILHLEYCFEKVLGEKPINMSMKSVASALESCYMDYSHKLDALHSDAIKGAVGRYIELERRKMNKAKIAARELRLFQRLERELLRSCLPVAQNNTVPLPLVRRRRVPPKPSKTKPVPVTPEVTRASLTEAEVEYLVLFTDWTEAENPADFLQDLSLRKQSKTEDNT